MPKTDVLGHELVGESAVIDLPLELVEPDPNQARWILPPEVRVEFQAGNLTSVQALERWRKMAGYTDKPSKKPSNASEQRRLEEIKALAKSIQSGGQINPITVVRFGDHWRIETGERRFWAHVWLMTYERDERGKTIPAMVRPLLDPFRQAVENLHASPLNAVGEARTITRLIQALGEEDRNPAPGQDIVETFNMAAYRVIARRRVRRGGWQRIEEAMGKTADHLARLVRLLLLPDEVLLLADRNDLTEKQLRALTELEDSDKQIRIAGLAVELSLSSSDVEWLCQQDNLDKAERELRARLAAESNKAPSAKFPPEQLFYRRVSGLVRLAQSVEKGIGDPAEALASQYRAERGEAAAAELETLISVLEGALAKLSDEHAEGSPVDQQPLNTAEPHGGLGD